MTRDELTQWLEGQFNGLQTAAGIQVGDYGHDVDAAFRALGVTDPLTATTTTNTEVFIALGEYFALNRILRHLATHVDISLDQPAVNKRRSQAFEQTKWLFERAQAQVRALGYGQSAMRAVTINIDVFEPAAEV